MPNLQPILATNSSKTVRVSGMIYQTQARVFVEINMNGEWRDDGGAMLTSRELRKLGNGLVRFAGILDKRKGKR